MGRPSDPETLCLNALETIFERRLTEFTLETPLGFRYENVPCLPKKPLWYIEKNDSGMPLLEDSTKSEVEQVLPSSPKTS